MPKAPRVPKAPARLLDPYARAVNEVEPGILNAANAISSAIYGNANRQVGLVNRRVAGQQAVLQPYIGRAASYGQQGSAAIHDLGNAISSATSALGQQLGGDIGAKLSNIQAPSQAPAQAVAQAGQGAAAAQGGLSQAQANQLTAAGNAEQAFAAGLPRIAQLAGQADIRDIVAQAADQYATQMAQLKSQEFSQLIDSQRYYADQAYQHKIDAQNYRLKQQQFKISRADYWRSYRDHIRQEKIANQQANAALGLKITGVNQAQQRIGISQQNANTSARRANTSAQQGWARIHEQTLRDDRNWQAKQQSLGIQGARLSLAARQQARLEAARQGKAGGLSEAERRQYGKEAIDAVSSGYAAKQNPKRIYNYLIGEQVPPSIALQAIQSQYPDFGKKPRASRPPKTPPLYAPGSEGRHRIKNPQ